MTAGAHVVLVAHGPRAVTKEAVARIRMLGDAASGVTIVPAAPSTRISQGMFHDTVVADGHGSNAVRTVATDLGGTPVLLLHDDVAITRHGLDRMLDELPHATFVTCFSNEEGIGTSIGALPRAKRAGPELDRLRGRLQRKPVLEARYACLLTRGHDLAGLGGSLVMPGSTLTRPDANIVAAPCAVAHDVTCNQQLAPDRLDPHEPLIVASMIVRDEEAALPAALRSMQDLVDRIEICDTGSVDGTLGVIDQAGANVRQIEWRNDFAWARNQALETCRDSEYVLIVDADERVKVKQPREFRRWLRTWSHEIDGLLINVESDRSSDSTTTVSCRLARARGLSWHGAIHESLSLEGAAAETKPSVLFHRGLRLEHEGYRPEVVELKAKPERNVAISRAAYEADASLKTIVDLARSLRMVDADNEESERLFREALAMVRPDHHPTSRSFLHAVVAGYELDAGNLDRAIELSELALDEVAGEDVALSTIGDALSRREEYDRLVALWENLSRRSTGNPMFSIPRNVTRWRSHVGRAMLHVRRIEDAQEMLTGALATDAEGCADIAAQAAADAIDAGLPPSWILPLIAVDTTGLVVDLMARILAPRVTVDLCLTALDEGAGQHHLFTTLVTAALITGQPDVARAGLRHAHLGDPETLERLADLAVRKGDEELAGLLLAV